MSKIEGNVERQFTAVIVKSGDWYAGTVKELSGVHSQCAGNHRQPRLPGEHVCDGRDKARLRHPHLSASRPDVDVVWMAIRELSRQSFFVLGRVVFSFFLPSLRAFSQAAFRASYCSY